MDDVKGPDNPEYFERLVSEYQGQLRRLCCVLLKDTHMAEDAVQETFLKVYRSLGSFRGESSERTWLTRVAVNTCRDMMKSRWFRHMDRSVKIEDLPEPAAPEAPEDTGLADTVLRLPDGEAPMLTAAVVTAGIGEEYIVREAQKTDNTLYQCGGLGESFRETSMVLNRLVDPEAAERILADGAEYLPERKND